MSSRAGRHGFALLVAAASISAFGCGSSDSGDPPPTVDCTDGCWEPTAADEAFITELCTLTEACCVANEYRDASDLEGCADGFRRAGFSRDAALRASCLAELKGLASTGISCVPEASDLSDACVRVTYEPSGPQAPGQPCLNRADCAGAPGTITLCAEVTSEVSPTSGLCMRLALGEAGSEEQCLGAVSSEGLILAAPRYVLGRDAPVTTGVVCEEGAGLQCARETDLESWTCLPLSADGAACNYSTTCASKQCLTSEGSEAGFDRPGTCTKRVPAGQVCNDSISRALCDDKSFCLDDEDASDASGTCESRRPAGSPCDVDSMCLSDRCDIETTNLCSTQTHSERLALFAYCARL
jgi:hypothetical protein